MRLTPVQVAVLYFGGLRPLARALGAPHTTIARWTTRPSGAIPNSGTDWHRRILEEARKRRIPITCADLIVGREVRLLPVSVDPTEP